MKNIHVLPTENESRLRYNSFNKVYELCEFPKYHTDIKSTHNIYITSDEEIKEGDWYIFPLYKKGFSIKRYNSVEHFSKEPCISLANLKAKKIILTTDQELISDGVQDIDDEFLEWFVKNPSCENVGVTFGCLEVRQCMCDSNSRCLKPGYKIIIPKEEPKQETLEEYIEKLYPKDDSRYDFTVTSKIRNGIREGAKWQVERMYSEEEVYDILIHHTIELFKKERITLEDFWNKFRKK